MELMTEAENTKPELPEHVRVRFCPSPTGIPHVGMVRTALFNWAEARHTKGTFVFRIEDTDAQRDSEESYNQIIEALNWLGIDWDEGINVGGPDGPYRQSERGDIYKDVAAKLLEAGYAYESFSTPEEIEARNVVAGRPKAFGYDGYDRDLTEEQKAAFRAEGRKPALRIRMPDEDVAFDDLIRGRIEFKAGSVPDYVIVRPNGDPLYTLTNPVDDAMMNINVVLRGEDLLSSTPRQIVLYRYLIELGVAKEMPLFGHMPYVMGQGNKKLSKRDPESNLFLHRDNGFIREGLLNYLALLALGTFYFLCAFLPIYFGAEHAKTIIDVLPQRLIDGLGVAGGIMPAIGFAVLLKIMMKNVYIPYFILGFVAAAWLKLPVLAIAAAALAMALIDLLRKSPEPTQPAAQKEEFEDGI